MKKKIKITYLYEINYGNEEHLLEITESLKSYPVKSLTGAGTCSDGRAYSYSCQRIGDGEANNA